MEETQYLPSPAVLNPSRQQQQQQQQILPSDEAQADEREATQSQIRGSSSLHGSMMRAASPSTKSPTTNNNHYSTASSSSQQQPQQSLPFSILRSVDRNSSGKNLFSVEKKTATFTHKHNNQSLFHTPQKQQHSSDYRKFGQSLSSSSSSVNNHNHNEGTDTNMMPFTPNSVDKEFFFPVEPSHSDESDRPHCTNPVGLTLFYQQEDTATTASEDEEEDPAAEEDECDDGGDDVSMMMMMDSPAPMVGVGQEHVLLAPPAQVIRPMATRSSQWSWTHSS